MRPFDCLVHLANSLLHLEDILAEPSSTQIEDILQITSTSPLYGQLLLAIPQLPSSSSIIVCGDDDLVLFLPCKVNRLA